MSVEKDVRSKLGQLPETLKQQYATIYQDIIESGSSTASIARKAFSWILAAQRALSTEEFIAAVALEDDGYYHGDLDVSRVLDICRNLIVVVSTDDDQSNQSFQVAHLSVKEYLMDMPDFSSERIHTTAMLRCLQTFDSKSLVEKRFISRIEDMTDVMRDYRIYLFEHAELSELTKSSSPLTTIMKTFLFDNNLNCTSMLQKWTDEAQMSILSEKIYRTTNFHVIENGFHKCLPGEGLIFVCHYGLLSVLETWSDDFELLQRQFRGYSEMTLYPATYRRKYAVVQWLLEKRIFEAYDASTYASGLSCAIRGGDVVLVDLYLKHGADPLARGDWGYASTPLALAFPVPGLGIFRSLLLTIERTCEERPELYSELAFDWKIEAFFRILYYGWTEAIEMLIERGADIFSWTNGRNMNTPEHSTTLQVAVKYSSLATIQTLLKVASKSSSEADERKAANTKSQFNIWVNSLDRQGRSAILCLGDRTVGTSDDNECIMKLLLAHNADPRITSSDGTTAIHAAASIGSQKMLQILQETGLDIYSRANSGATALHAAARGRHSTSNIVRFLIGEGLDPLDPDLEGRTSLHYAAESCNAAALTALREALLSTNPVTESPSHGPTALSDSAPNATAIPRFALPRFALPRRTFSNITDLKGNTPLHLVGDGFLNLFPENRPIETEVQLSHVEDTIQFSHVEDTIQLLLDLGVDMNQQNNAGRTPVLNLIDTYQYITHNVLIKYINKIVKVLLVKGASARAPDFSGITPMHSAARTWGGTVEVLLRAGADIEAKDHDMCTPLHVSSDSGNYETTACLLQYGANPRARNSNQATPLHYAVQNEYHEFVISSIILLLVRAKADVNAVDNTGRTPLHWALNTRRKNAVRILLYHKANPDIADNSGATPLHYAARDRYDCSDIISVLIRAQTNVDSKDKSGSTPLHLAAKLGHPEIVQKLLHAGADPDIINNQGVNAVQIAAREASMIYEIVEGVKNKNDEDDEDERDPVDFLRAWYHLHKALVDRGAEHELQSTSSTLKRSQSVILRTDRSWGDFSNVRAEEIARL